MTYKISELEIPDENPFQNDALDRKPLVDFLIGLIGRAGGPFVLALDSPWGTGKTTIIRMLRAELEKQNFATVYFNAWKVDFATDPIVPLVSALDQLTVGDNSTEKFGKYLAKARKLVTILAKHTIVAGVKASTVGLLNIEEGIETAIADSAGAATEDIVAAFQSESKLLEEFRAELEKAVSKLPEEGRNQTLVFFVDELDRCRPNFAIELLERIKHLFDVPNIHFVLSLDKRQLEASVAAVYGAGINAKEYLRRFFDLEYALPAIGGSKFVESLIYRFGIDRSFAARMQTFRQDEMTGFVECFCGIANAHGMSHRAQERAMTRLRVVLDQSNSFMHPIFVALLIILRSENAAMYTMLAQGKGQWHDVMDYLNALPNPTAISDRDRMIFEAYFIAAEKDYDIKSDKIRALNKASNDENDPNQSYAREVKSILSTILSLENEAAKVSAVYRKIDFADRIRNPFP